MRVQISLPEEDYAALSKLAEEEDRTVAGQARHMLRRALFLAKNEEQAHEINAALAVTSLTPRQAQLAAEYGATGHPGEGLPLDALDDELRQERYLHGEHQPGTHDVTGSAGPGQLRDFKPEEAFAETKPLPG